MYASVKVVEGPDGFFWEAATLDGEFIAVSRDTYPTRDEATQARNEAVLRSLERAIYFDHLREIIRHTEAIIPKS